MGGLGSEGADEASAQQPGGFGGQAGRGLVPDPAGALARRSGCVGSELLLDGLQSKLPPFGGAQPFEIAGFFFLVSRASPQPCR